MKPLLLEMKAIAQAAIHSRQAPTSRDYGSRRGWK